MPSASTPTAHFSSRERTTHPNVPTVQELADGAMNFLGMMVLVPTICPGFFLCVPGLVLAMLPVIALGLLAVAGGLIVVAVAAPLLAARAVVVRIGRAYAARRTASPRAQPTWRREPWAERRSS